MSMSKNNTFPLTIEQLYGYYRLGPNRNFCNVRENDYIHLFKIERTIYYSSYQPVKKEVLCWQFSVGMNGSLVKPKIQDRFHIKYCVPDTIISLEDAWSWFCEQLDVIAIPLSCDQIPTTNST